ncbi:MAG: hypothetical protein GEU28_12240 [Dehalococcoidia bacterium]|nr:hypothetical protein [Dehalococcoidia bacterium]
MPSEREHPPQADPAQPDEYPTLLDRVRGRDDPFLDTMPEAMGDVDQRFKELERLPAADDALASHGQAPYTAPEAPRERRYQPDASGQLPWKVLAVLLFALALAAFIGAFTAWRLTAEAPATAVNERVVNQLTEVDRYLDLHEQEIREAEPDDSGLVALPTFPLQVALSGEEARGLPREEMTGLIVQRGAQASYDRGVQAYGTDASLFEDFTAPGLVRVGIEFMHDSTHDRMLLLTVVAGVFMLGFATIVVILSHGAGRLTALGSGVAIAGVISLVLSFVARALFDSAASGDDDAVAVGLRAVAHDVIDVFTRNSLIFLVAGVATLVLGVLVAINGRRRGDQVDRLHTTPASPDS